MEVEKLKTDEGQFGEALPGLQTCQATVFFV